MQQAGRNRGTENPFSPLRFERVFLVGTRFRGRHYGQRPMCAASTGRTHGRTDRFSRPFKPPFQRRAVHTWRQTVGTSLAINGPKPDTPSRFGEGWVCPLREAKTNSVRSAGAIQTRAQTNLFIVQPIGRAVEASEIDLSGFRPVGI